MLKYTFCNRKIIEQNSRFYICYDTLHCNSGSIVNDYLVIKPKITHDCQIVGVCILPFIDNRFCLMKVWRHQFDSEIWQAPAGFVEPGESSIESAHRELLEETGLECKYQDIISLGSYIPDAGLIEGKVALYLASRCNPTSHLREHEIGTGNLNYFSPSALLKLLVEATNIGGSTCIAAYRSLNVLNLLA